MSLREPFRTDPVRLGDYRHRQRRTSFRRNSVRYLGSAAILGTIVGVASVATDPSGQAAVAATIRPLAVKAGVLRAREPRPGDYWPGCDAARAAGTAPIYSGEPGYREGMDGDNDGIACEPYH